MNSSFILNLVLVAAFISILFIFGLVQFMINNNRAELAAKERHTIINNQEHISNDTKILVKILDILQNKSK
jgi:hypothetical protein